MKNSTISNTKLRENFHPFVPHGLFVRIWLNLKKCPGGQFRVDYLGWRHAPFGPIDGLLELVEVLVEGELVESDAVVEVVILQHGQVGVLLVQRPVILDGNNTVIGIVESTARRLRGHVKLRTGQSFVNAICMCLVRLPYD